MNEEFVIWDHTDHPNQIESTYYLWSGYGESEDTHSLLRYIEDNGERFRSRYLAFIHDFGEYVTNGKTTQEHLAIDQSFSYWWMSLLAEKSSWKTKEIVSVIKLFALEEIIKQTKPSSVLLVSNNDKLSVIVKRLCIKLGVSYSEKSCAFDGTAPVSQAIKTTYLGHCFFAVKAFIGHVKSKWFLRNEFCKYKWETGNNIFFATFFFHLHMHKIKDGKFYSNYLEELPRLINEMGKKQNWLQFYYHHNDVQSAKEASGLISNINAENHSTETHRLLDSYLSVGVLLKVIYRYFYISIKAVRVKKQLNIFTPSNSDLSLEPILGDVWAASLSGRVLVDNLIWFGLFEKLMKDLPHQKKGIFLFENHGWERAFIHLWKRHGHGTLIAYAHSSVRFWDLRYYTDPRVVHSESRYSIPLPDAISANGPESLRSFFGSGYSLDTVHGCEALRYGHLNHVKDCREKSSKLEVLLLGDYEAVSTLEMLETVEKAALILNREVNFTFKPHPNFLINVEDYESVSRMLDGVSVGEILGKFDVVYSCNLTTAAVDAYLGGLPVIVCVDEKTLNFSPLRDAEDVTFVASGDALAEKLEKITTQRTNRLDDNEMFFLDENFPRWKKLLNS